MDPLTAVGLAGTIVQFVDFSCKLIKTGAELNSKGQLESHKYTGMTAWDIGFLAARAGKDLQEFKAKLDQKPELASFSHDVAEDELVLRRLCMECS